MKAKSSLGFHTIDHYLVEGGDCALRKEEKNASELLGLKHGTAWPAPRNVANVSPSYS